MSTPDSTAPLRIPQPDEVSDREKEDAMGAYFMMFAGLGLGAPLPLINLVASVVYWAIHRRKSRFVAFHSLQSLLEQIPVTLFNAGLIAWLLVILFTDLVFPREFWVALVFVVAGEHPRHRHLRGRPHEGAQGALLLHAALRPARLQRLLRAQGAVARKAPGAEPAPRRVLET